MPTQKMCRRANPHVFPSFLLTPHDVRITVEDTCRTLAVPTQCPHKETAIQAISEKIVEGLPIPAAGNKVHNFSGASLQGK
jgi:hypothetical protein